MASGGKKRSSRRRETASPPGELPIGRGAVPPALEDPDQRVRWGLPAEDAEPGHYMVELNLLHRKGLEEANKAFKSLFAQEVTSKHADRSATRVARSYYQCFMSADDWKALVKADQELEARDRCIYRVWPDFEMKPMIDRSIATVKADAAGRAYAALGAGITWAVIDSGIAADHPHFGPEGSNLLRHDDVALLHRDFLLPDPELAEGDEEESQREVRIRENVRSALEDEFGHGTHVAGIIAGGFGDPRATTDVECRVYERRVQPTGDAKSKKVALRPDSVAAKQLNGVAPLCKLISLKVLDGNGRGRSSVVMRALEYIRENLNGNPKLLRVHGVNLSVGYEFDAEMFACGQSPLCVEVDRLVQSGVVVVTAAGNTGYGTVESQQRSTKVGMSNTINDPGNAALAITVGATHRDAPHTYGVSYFSSKGPTGDGRLKPDLVAPGERITSCAVGRKLADIAPTNGDAPSDKRLAYYIDDSGTSMAAPHVSGAIAAFLSIRREFVGKPLEVKQIFLNSATSLGRERYFQGHGLLDLMRAIQSV